jgi:hypothetical protein
MHRWSLGKPALVKGVLATLVWTLASASAQQQVAAPPNFSDGFEVGWMAVGGGAGGFTPVPRPLQSQSEAVGEGGRRRRDGHKGRPWRHREQQYTRTHICERSAAALEHIPIEWIGICSASFALAHVLIGKPVSTFPEHALAAETTSVPRS